MRTWDYIYCVPVGKWMALRFNIWVVSEVNGRSNAWVFSIGVMGGGPVRKETVDLCTSEHNNQEVCENMLTVILSNPSLSSPPNPTLCRLPDSIYPARAAISPQWSNANGLSVQEVRDGCGSERNSWEIFGTPGQKQVKAGAETKPEMQQVGVGKEAQPLSSCVTLAVIGSEAERKKGMWKKMWTDVFFDGDTVSGGVGRVCKFSHGRWCWKFFIAQKGNA